jgi:hypothetical protein
MHLMAPREKWTDGELEDLNQRVDEGFADLGTRIDTLEIKSEGLEKKVDEGFGRLDQDIRELRGEIKGLNRGLLAMAVAIIAAVIGTGAFS